MAKFANITYGTKGESEEYTYVVNDNVRTGDYIQPSVKHYKSGKIFGTTGIVQSATKTTTAKGQKLKQEIEQKTGNNVANAYTGKELGVKAEKDEKGKYKYVGGMGKTVKDESSGKFVAKEGKTFTQNEYIQKTRQLNVERREQNTSNSTTDNFDSYSKQFMKEND